MAEIVTTIGGVLGSITKTGKTRYAVTCGDGKEYSTFESTLAGILTPLAGSQRYVKLDVNESRSQDGKYTNLYVNGLLEVMDGQALPPPQMPAVDTTPKSSKGNWKSGGMTEVDKARIAKMAAQGTAAVEVSALFQGAGPEAAAQMFELIDARAKKLYLDARSHEKTEQQPVAQPVPQPVTVPSTPAQVAETVPGVVVGTSQVQSQTAEPVEAGAVQWD